MEYCYKNSIDFLFYRVFAYSKSAPLCSNRSSQLENAVCHQTL